jgi:hypothetical protein
LLHQFLTEQDIGECQKILDGLKRFVFSKPRGRRMFLHDEMYSWMQDKVLKKSEEEREEVCQTAITYYAGLISSSAKQKRVLLAEQVYYHVVKNQRAGFERFARLANDAILEHDFDFELMLRDEVLRAFNEWQRRVPDYYHRDAAVRRVMRIIETVGTNRHTYEEAIQTADKILGTKHHVFVEYQGLNDTKDPLFTLALWTYRAEAQLLSGQQPPLVMQTMFEDIIKRLAELTK